MKCVCFAAPSGGEEGYGARRGRRGRLLVSRPPDPQAGAADRPGKDQEDQRSGVSSQSRCVEEEAAH